MKTKKLKIVTIGGGSSYTPEIIEGFIKRASTLPIKEICLVDIEEGKEKLEIVGNLAKRMVEKAGLDWKVTLTLNRRKALKDADFVTTQFRVGLLEARIRDERIPLSMGMMGQETNGAGGFAKAMRTIPVILDICKDMEEICPEAWLINFTNPSGMITEVVLNYTKIKAIGLCNVPVGMAMAIAEVLGVKKDEFLFHATGINHYVFGKHVYYKGKDILLELMPKLMKSEKFNPKNITDIPWMEEQIEKIGLMPCPYHKYYYLTGDMLRKQIKDYEQNGTRAETVKKVEIELFELYKDPNLKEKPKQLEQRGGAYYSEAACELINSLYNDLRVPMVVNILNKGTIKCLPDNASIETTCLISSAGAIPLTVGRLPLSAEGELQTLKTYEQVAIQAALTGDYGIALHALTINPLVESGTKTKEVLNRIIKENIKYLPQFKLAYDEKIK
ncbi:MAG: 6-phospho-beta-glucosidase [Fusobacteriaceae bacterium]